MVGRIEGHSINTSRQGVTFVPNPDSLPKKADKLRRTPAACQLQRRISGKETPTYSSSSSSTFDRHDQEGEAGDPQSPRPVVSSRGGSEDRSMVATSAAVYRRVLKAVQKHVGGGDCKKHFREFVASEFRRPTGTDADTRARLRLAGDYAYLLASVHHHKDLLFSYNIAVDRSEEMKKILNKSAASVGLQLPDVYQA
uniref:Uncharacterized protein n=1 Tax=Oryza punctata TaxID=4537 RepID=A0A0E0MC47_ORYPU